MEFLFILIIVTVFLSLFYYVLELPLILLIAAGCLIVFVYVLYVRVVSRRNQALQALSGIDVQLKQRWDLVPNILKLAARFMEHEKSLMSDITALRENAAPSYNPKDTESLKHHLAASEALGQRMGQLMIKAENYPDMKSDQTMVQAMQTYNEVEAQIAAARRFYNASVTDLNNSVQIFPGNVLAKIAGIGEMPFYETDQVSRGAVNVDDFMKS
jgi:LemA protein